MMKHQRIIKLTILGIVVLFILVAWIIYNNTIAPYKLNIPNEIDAVFIRNGNNGKSIEAVDDKQKQQLVETMNNLELQKTYKKEASTGWCIMIVVVESNKNYQYVVNSQEIIYNDYIYTNPKNQNQMADLYSELCKLFD